MKRIIIIFIFPILFTCKSTDIETIVLSNSLLGIVFDEKSNPIQNAIVTFYKLDGKEVVKISTDIDGRFFIPELEFDTYNIKVISKYIPETDLEIDHYDIENVLIVKIKTYEDLLLELEKSIKINDNNKNKILINNLKIHYKNSLFFNYLVAINYYKNEQFSLSKDTLITLIDRDNPYVYLLLADIYQYKLNNIEKAIYYLKLYLEDQYNIIGIKRLKELENDI